MYNITLICTIHNEIGKCNSKELLKIIECYNPDIIFEEISKVVYKQCYGLQNRYTLETKAIKMYSNYKDIVHVPVVGEEIILEEKLKIMIQYDDYRYLIDRLICQEEKYGFDFLNSEACEDLFLKMAEVEKSISMTLKDEQLLTIISSSDASVCRYENEIIENVYEYSKHNKFEKALLFIGAAHRKSIVGRIQEFNKQESFKLNWSFQTAV